jgi:uncharacterized protein
MTLRTAAIFTIAHIALFAQPPAPKRLLVIGDVSTKNYQHDSVSHALAVIERLGRDSGLYVATIRTDTQLLTKLPIEFAVKSTIAAAHYQTLDDFDAVFFYTIGEPVLTEQQKADFLSFIQKDGKGFVGAHTATSTFTSWPAYGDMIGAYFDDHPWDVFDANIVVEDATSPMMKAFPTRFQHRDEIYQVKDFSRENVHVLARLDTSQLDLSNPRVHRKDGDFPIAWTKTSGKGRVFYSSLGHTDQSWDDPKIQSMWLEAARWVMRTGAVTH